MFLKAFSGGIALIVPMSNLVARTLQQEQVNREAVGLAPAVGNAIFDATRVRIRSLPLAPDGINPRSSAA